MKGREQQRISMFYRSNDRRRAFSPHFSSFTHPTFIAGLCACVCVCALIRLTQSPRDALLAESLFQVFCLAGTNQLETQWRFTFNIFLPCILYQRLLLTKLERLNMCVCACVRRCLADAPSRKAVAALEASPVSWLFGFYSAC